MALAFDRIYLGDCRSLLPQIVPASAALVLTSPPFNLGKPYEVGVSFDAWEQLLRDAVRLSAIVLRQGGFLVLNVADVRACPVSGLDSLQAECRHLCRSPVTVAQIEALRAAEPGLSEAALARRLATSQATIARRLRGHLARGRSGGPQRLPTVLRPVGGVVERALADAGLLVYDKRTWQKSPNWTGSPWAASSFRAIDEQEELWFGFKPGPFRYGRERLSRQEWTAWGNRAIWAIPSVARADLHPAAFPVELPRRVIRMLTDPGDLVVDPFVGSGTTAVAAQELNRHWLGFDADRAYVELARRRLAR